MESVDKQVALGVALALAIALFIPFYWLNEPNRQGGAAAQQRQGAIDRGAEVFVNNCVNCHGMGGQGGIGSPLRNSRLDAKTMEKIISRGIPSTVMPAWSSEDGGPLKRHQIEEVVIFLKDWDDPAVARAMEHQIESYGAPDGDARMEGNGTRGGILYQITGCAACHGPQAEGRVGPRLKGKNLALAQLLNRVRNAWGGMPSYEERELSNPDVKDIQAFLAGLR